MAFPQSILPITVELQINGTWTDVSTDARGTDGTSAITIQRGITSSGGMLADRGSCSLTLDNNSGKYSSRNPTSPYYGYLGRNTPLRVGVSYGTPWLDIPANSQFLASTPDAAVLDIAGDLDLRADVELPTWGDPSTAPTFTNLITKYGLSGQRSWFFGLNSEGVLVLYWSADGSTLLNATSTTPPPFSPRQRGSVRVTLDVDNGASGNTVAFYTSTTPGTAGPWTQLGSTVVQSGTTSIFNSTTAVEIGHATASNGATTARKIYAAEVRSGIGGTIVANPDFTSQTVGATSFNDTAPSPRTWTVSAGALSNTYRRFVGEVSSWPPQWDTGGKDVTTPITASGILQRIGQRKAPLQSTLRRRIPGIVGIQAYWPMEDGGSATQASSPIAGVSPARATGFTWASDSSLAGSMPLPQLAPPSTLFAKVPTFVAGDWQVEFVYKLDTLPASPTNLITVNLAGGTAAQVQFLIGVATAQVQALDASGTVLATGSVTPDHFTDGWGRLQIKTSTSGGTVNLFGEWLISGTATSVSIGMSYAGTPGGVSSVVGSWGSSFADLRMGHLAVFPETSPNLYDNADIGFDGETVAARLARVASEQSVPMSVAAHSADTELVGPQAQDTLLNVLQAAAQADEGPLHEAREFIGLRFRGRRSLEDQSSALDLPYVATPQALMAPLTPVDDDQGTLNDSTVTRTGGSSGRSTVTTGSLSTQDPPNGVGQYDESIALNLHTDDQTLQHASWRTYLGTWDEARFPQVNIELAKNPGLIPAVSRIDTGSRIRITAPLPSWLPPDAIDELVLGYTETMAQYSWRLSFACQPYGPYRLATTDDYTLGRAGTDSTTLTSNITSSATSLSATVNSGNLWSTDPGEAPWNIRVAGEVMRVDAVGSIVNGNPYLDTNATGWTAAGGTAVWSAAQLHPNNATGALFITPDGVSASGGANAATSASGTITAGNSYIACMWVYSPGGWSDLRPAVDWFTSGSTFLSTSLGSGFTVPAATWTFLTQTFVAPATAARASMRARHGGTPASTNTWYAWAIRLVPVTTSPSSPQTFQVTRSINTVVKAQTAGADIRLDQPAYVAL